MSAPNLPTRYMTEVAAGRVAAMPPSARQGPPATLLGHEATSTAPAPAPDQSSAPSSSTVPLQQPTPLLPSAHAGTTNAQFMSTLAALHADPSVHPHHSDTAGALAEHARASSALGEDVIARAVQEAERRGEAALISALASVHEGSREGVQEEDEAGFFAGGESLISLSTNGGVSGEASVVILSAAPGVEEAAVQEAAQPNSPPAAVSAVEGGKVEGTDNSLLQAQTSLEKQQEQQAAQQQQQQQQQQEQQVVQHEQQAVQQQEQHQEQQAVQQQQEQQQEQQAEQQQQEQQQEQQAVQQQEQQAVQQQPEQQQQQQEQQEQQQDEMTLLREALQTEAAPLIGTATSRAASPVFPALTLPLSTLLSSARPAPSFGGLPPRPPRPHTLSMPIYSSLAATLGPAAVRWGGGMLFPSPPDATAPSAPALAWRYPKEASDPDAAAAVRVQLTGSLHRAEMAHFAALHAPSMLATLPGAFAKFAATPLKLWAACEKRVGEAARAFQATAMHRATALAGILEAGRGYGEACAVWDAAVAGSGASHGSAWPEEGPPPASTVCKEVFRGGYLHPELSGGRMGGRGVPTGRIGQRNHFYILLGDTGDAASGSAGGNTLYLPITMGSASARPIPSLPAAAEALAALPIAAWHQLRYLQTPFPLATTVLSALAALLALSQGGTGGGAPGSGAGSAQAAATPLPAASPAWQHILALMNDPRLPSQCLALTAQAAHLAEMLAEEQAAAAARANHASQVPPAILAALTPAVANSALGDLTASVSGLGLGGLGERAAAGSSSSSSKVSIPIPTATAFPELALSFASVQAARRILAQRPDARAECSALSISVWPRPGTVLASVEAGGDGGAAGGGAPLPLFVLQDLPALAALLDWELALVTAVEEAQTWDMQRELPPSVHGLLPEGGVVGE